jgi:hypothetical protein
VTIKGTNVFKSNNGYGLAVYATGAITLSNVTASLNDADGVYLQNDLIKVQTKVTLTGYGLFEWNGSADPFFQDGLYVQSHGAITLANITANYNFGNGAILSTAGVSAPQAVTLTGTNNFNYNGDASQESGLIVNSDGNIIVNNLNANYNYYGGAYLDNQTNWANRVPSPFLTFGSVTLTGVGNFDGNTLWDGLQVLTHGSVTLNHVTANENGGSGSGIDLSSVDGNATLICSRVYGNAAYGLYGAVTGTLTLTGFSAYGNTPADESISYGTVVRTTCP